MGFPGQEYWSGLPFPSTGDLLDPRTEHTSPALAGRFFTIQPPGKSKHYIKDKYILEKTIEKSKKIIKIKFRIFNIKVIFLWEKGWEMI